MADNNDIVVDATIIGELLGVAASDVPWLMRTRAITSVCERGIEAHQGEYRLNFFYQNRRARVSLDAKGKILRRSVVNFNGALAETAARGRRVSTSRPYGGAQRHFWRNAKTA